MVSQLDLEGSPEVSRGQEDALWGKGGPATQAGWGPSDAGTELPPGAEKGSTASELLEWVEVSAAPQIFCCGLQDPRNCLATHYLPAIRYIFAI